MEGGPIDLHNSSIGNLEHRYKVVWSINLLTELDMTTKPAHKSVGFYHYRAAPSPIAIQKFKKIKARCSSCSTFMAITFAFFHRLAFLFDFVLILILVLVEFGFLIADFIVYGAELATHGSRLMALGLRWAESH